MDLAFKGCIPDRYLGVEVKAWTLVTVTASNARHMSVWERIIVFQLFSDGESGGQAFVRDLSLSKDIDARLLSAFEAF
jgi:hypothetical protein